MQRFFDRRSLILILILAYLGPIRALMNSGTAGLSSWIVNTLITIPGIIIGLSFHEYAHAITAYKCGDVTPKIMGRCTVEPQAHVDLMGILSLLFIGFGWGKPVVVNPANFRNRHRDTLLVDAAGVTMNFVVALVFGLILKIFVAAVPQIMMDGFGFFTELLHLQNTQFYSFVYRNSLVILLVLIILDVPSMVLSRPIYAIVNFITSTLFHIY